MTGRHAVAAALALLADRGLGEPPAAIHPVAAFGRAMTGLEHIVRPSSALWRNSSAQARPTDSSRGGSWREGRLAGAGYAAGGLGLGWAAGFALGPSVPAGALATWLVVAGRALGQEARSIADRLVVDDLDGARRRLPALVGRDPDSLDGKGVARAVVESVAENTVDAVVAPACWAAIGGAAGAGFYRAANTLDAMVGHRNERYRDFGWASARLDDAANWIPARLTALLVAAVRPTSARDVLDALAHPPAHPSPNAGVAEAAFAAALGLRLGGDTVYAGRVDPRPAFGTGRSPEPGDIDAAIRLSRDVTLALAAALATPALLASVARRPNRRSAVPALGTQERQLDPGDRASTPAVPAALARRPNRRSFTGIARKTNASCGEVGV